MIPPIPTGKKRQWVKCKECGLIAHYDYAPHSLEQPIMTMPCGHDMGQSFNQAVIPLDADTALIELSRVGAAVLQNTARKL